MNQEQQLKEIFASALGVPLDKVNDTLETSNTSEWDSVGHIELITAIEEGFSIELEDDDLFAMNSYLMAKEILVKYGINV
jgi:acyl carrier protein